MKCFEVVKSSTIAQYERFVVAPAAAAAVPELVGLLIWILATRELTVLRFRSASRLGLEMSEGLPCGDGGGSMVRCVVSFLPVCAALWRGGGCVQAERYLDALGCTACNLVRDCPMPLGRGGSRWFGCTLHMVCVREREKP